MHGLTRLGEKSAILYQCNGSVDTLRPQQNGPQYIFIEFLLKYVSGIQLIIKHQSMVWCRTGDMPLYEPKRTLHIEYIRHSAAMNY